MIAATCVSAAATLGCPPGDGTNLDAFGNPVGPPTSTDSVTFAADVQPIFTQNCAFTGGCHAGTSPAQAMNLSAGLAYANIVNVTANEAPLRRIRPLLPDSSYLVHKLQGTQANVGGSGGQMPLGGTPLTVMQISRLRAWITLGAKNN